MTDRAGHPGHDSRQGTTGGGQLDLKKIITSRAQRPVQDSLGALLKADVTEQDRTERPREESMGIADKARRLQKDDSGHDGQGMTSNA
jgi:hypothetical protein